MALSRAQIILLQRARADAGLEDADYREALHLVAGVNSSKDPRINDVHLDRLLAYFEAIYWGHLDAAIQVKPSRVFSRRGYWAGKNRAGHNSRDRFLLQIIKKDILKLEAELAELGFGDGYIQSIYRNTVRDQDDPSAHSLAAYRHALSRTLSAKRKEHAHAHPNRD